MSHTLRIGSAIDPVDPYWVQVREAAYERAEQLPLDLISINLVDPFEALPEERKMALMEELQGLELDAIIAWSLPPHLVYSIPQFGIPLILLSETEMQHPLLVSPRGLYHIARLGSDFLAQRLAGEGTVLALGGLARGPWQDDNNSWIAGIRDVSRMFSKISIRHIPIPWGYEQVYSEIYQAMQSLAGPVDALFGLSDTVALTGRQAGLDIGLIQEITPVVGIGGNPDTLAAITSGTVTATVEILTDELGRQAVDLAYQAAQGRSVPAHLEYKSRLVTAENVAEVAAHKLVTIANLPNRLVGVRRRQQQERLKQLETSLEISRRVGSILDPGQLSQEIANLIRANYGYDRVQIFHWIEEEQQLVLEQPEDKASSQQFRLTGSGVLGQALMRNEAIFIPDTRRSPRFSPDPRWPETRTRVVLPIRLGQQILGLLDLHSNRSVLRTRQELVGLQSLADQLGVAIQNARLYGEAVAARTSAEKADQLKTRLLANVSHELRTPLNVILSYIQTALESSHPYHVDLPPALFKDLQQIGRNANHLLYIINDLLDLSRAEIDELDLQPEIIEPHTFLTDVFANVSDSVEKSGDVEWHLQLPKRLPRLQADPVRLRQILFNLLSNAGKFTEQGQVVLGADVTPPHLHIWVQDSGMGIPAAQQERIFEPFITAGQQTRQREGIGLGLTITRRLVALHRGVLSLESKVRQGSTFHVYLPLPTLSDQPVVLPVTAQPVLLLVSSREKVAPEITALSRKQNLEIHRLRPDDSLETVLPQVAPAVVAWDLAGATSADWPVVQKLRHCTHLSQVPFIFYSQDQHEEAALNLGMTHLVSKPVSGKTLTDAINSLAPSQAVGPILIVDDDVQALELYQEMVSVGLPDYAIRVAQDGAAAVEIMQQASPSLVILDLMMPEMDGFEVLDWMRVNPQTRRVPVLVLSGRMLTFDDIKRMEQHAHTTFQTKDILSEEETTATVRRILSDATPLPAHTSALVKRTVAYLHQNYQEPLSREEIARTIGVSKNYLSHIFRRELGLSPWDYLNRYRIRQARELLMGTDQTITDVAYKVGFNNPAYFSRVFHQQTGISPSEYREQSQ